MICPGTMQLMNIEYKSFRMVYFLFNGFRHYPTASALLVKQIFKKIKKSMKRTFYLYRIILFGLCSLIRIMQIGYILLLF